MKSKNSPNSPATIDELVQFISKVVRDLHHKSGQRMDGSLLAYTIRSEYPGIDYTALGLSKLGDAVRIAEKCGFVVRHHDVSHLELSPADVAQRGETPRTISEAAERRYVRNDIWRAFLFRSSSTKFINRDTHETIEFSAERPREAEEARKSSKLVEIDRISDEIQVDWARQFIESSSDVKECSIDEAKTLVFPTTRKYSASYVRSWKLFLTSKVIDHIKSWAAKSDISTDPILVPTKQRSELKRFGPGESDETAIRQAVAAAISEMPLSDLDELAIPIKYIRRHFNAK